jgi:hypothetical protein
MMRNCKRCSKIMRDESFEAGRQHAETERFREIKSQVDDLVARYGKENLIKILDRI